MDLPEIIPPKPLAALSDDQLVDRLKTLGALDCRLTVALLLHLREFDDRKLYEELGFPSLFAYCVEELRYSEDVACKRIAAARASSRFPSMIERIEEGRLSLSAIVALAPGLTEENCEAVLSAAEGKSMRQVEALAASLMPARQAKDRLRWINAEFVELGFPATRRLAELLERAQDVRRHRFPDGRYGDILEDALELYLECHDPAWDLLPSIKRRSDPRSRDVPEAVKKEVWRRDQGRCTYVSPRGRRCGSKAWLEYDHIQPWARGGRSDLADNIRLMCRTHNQRLARDEFGVWALKKRPQKEELPFQRNAEELSIRHVADDPGPGDQQPSSGSEATG